MKKRILRAFVLWGIMLFMAFFSITVINAQTNLLTNPGFEEGSNGWQFQTSNGAAGTADFNSSAAARTGTYGALINVTTVTAENWHAQLNTPSNWNAELNATYHLSFYARCSQSTTIHVAIQDGPNNNYEYRTGFDFAIDNTGWKKIDAYPVSAVSGTGAMRINIYVGGKAAQYYFDDFSLVKDTFVNPGPITLPTKGAAETGIYRNLFKEMGKTDAEITAKVNQAFNQLYHGNADNEKLYYETGTDMAYMKDVANNDIRSEGLSYGMMIALQLNKRTEFDKLWKFSKTYAQHQTGPRKGYFAWQLNTSDFAKMDDNTAPDGDEYFAMALLFAARRWGNGSGIFNYEAEAQEILYLMNHLEDRNGGVVDGLVNMFNRTERMIVFVPKGEDATFTDPSYHLPGFYKLWAKWSQHDNTLWQEIADKSAAFLPIAMHDTTGLTTDYMTFTGQPKTTSFNENSHRFAYDSWRVAGNIGMDCHWFGNQGWQPQEINKLLRFFKSQGMGTYKTIYEQNGTPLADNNYHSTGCIAMNAVGALAATDEVAWEFVKEFWETAIPAGQYRYYDGMLYMLSLLHVSGNFKIYGSYTNTPTPTPTGQLLGDVNNSGTVDINDALLIARYSAGLNPPGFNAANGDCNRDGSVNINDALLVARYSAGLITSF